MFTKLAVTLNADDTRGHIPLAAHVSVEQAEKLAQRENAKLLRIMDNRYTSSRKNAIMNAWLTGAPVEELQRIHES